MSYFRKPVRFLFEFSIFIRCRVDYDLYMDLDSENILRFDLSSPTSLTTVPDPLKLQILLEDQTATEVLFQSYAATTTIYRMTWLACTSHYVRGHVHKKGHKYNGTTVVVAWRDRREGPSSILRLGPSYTIAEDFSEWIFVREQLNHELFWYTVCVQRLQLSLPSSWIKVSFKTLLGRLQFYWIRRKFDS